MPDRSSEPTPPRTDDAKRVGKLHGADRGGLGEEGWAEVPEDLVGGAPELETAPSSEKKGGLNGPQPETDRSTGAAKPANPD